MVYTYSIGICAASVCSDLSLEEITKQLNIQHPTGINSQWEFSPEPTFASGHPNPCECPYDSEGKHKHYLFRC